MENLPREIVIDILSKRPIKHLVRCRCVCRYWLYSTHGSRLVNLHLHRASQPNNNNPCLVLNPISTLIDAVNICTRFLFVENDEPIDCTPIKHNLPSLSKIFKCVDFVGGFGFDQKTNQCKVVIMVYWYEHCYEDEHGPLGPEWQSEVHVYGLGDGSWRHIGEAPLFFFMGQHGSKAFVNGALHWVSSNPSKLIVSFDIADEVFDVVSCPKFGLGEVSDSGRGRLSLVDSEFGLGNGTYSLGVLRGCLSLVNSSFKDHIEKWVMNNYGILESWTKYFAM